MGRPSLRRRQRKSIRRRTRIRVRPARPPTTLPTTVGVGGVVEGEVEGEVVVEVEEGLEEPVPAGLLEPPRKASVELGVRLEEIAVEVAFVWEVSVESDGWLDFDEVNVARVVAVREAVI